MVIKSMRKRWARHVAHIKAVRNAYQILVRKPKGKNHLEDQDIDGRTILRWILRKQGMRVWTGLNLLRIGPTAGSCEQSNESSASIKGGDFLHSTP
jgi:hypothetical protein